MALSVRADLEKFSIRRGAEGFRSILIANEQGVDVYKHLLFANGPVNGSATIASEIPMIEITV